jgi:hypothetical protein
MSATCEFEMRARYACKSSPVIGFDYCMEHLQTPRGLVRAQEIIANGGMPTIADLEKEIANRTSSPDVDYHTSALEKMDATLTEVMSWTEGSRKRLEAIDEDEWRYQDRARQEQVRAEVLIYERALDRSAKVLKDVSKMALQEKIVSLGRAQTELMIRLMMRVLENLHLDDVKFQQARMDLLVAFQEEANLASSVEREVTRELTAPVHSDIQDAEVVSTEYAS